MTLRVRGVVSPRGATAIWLAPDPEMWLNFEVQPWRVTGGSVQDRPLRLRMGIERDTGTHWIARAPSGAVVEVEINALDECERPQRMVQLHGPVDDPVLASMAANAPPPPELHDPLLGTLIYDPGVDWFEGEGVWLGRNVRLYLSCEPELDGNRALDIARRLWAEQSRWHALIREAILRDMLPLKNGSWREPEDEAIDAEQFLARIEIESIIVYPDGSLDFSHDDDDLFFGHTIVVTGTLDDGVQDVSLAG